MSGSSRRIAVVAAMLAVAVAVVVSALARLMVGDHAIWLERSYRNRWAFRDVPTRRGSICDRSGHPILQDEPRFALELDYDTFRRHNPIGAALAGAKLLWPHEYDHRRPGDAPRALARLLALPGGALHGDASTRETGRDLRFYVGSFVHELTARPWSECARLLLAAASARSERPVSEVLGLDPAALERSLAQRAERLQRLAATLRDSGGETDLGERLETSWRKHAEPDKPAIPSRSLAVDLPFVVAADLVCDHEVWRGFRLRPAVSRVADPRLPSLPCVLGVATPAGTGKDDPDTVGRLVDGLTKEAKLEDSLPEDLDLSTDALARLTARATSFLRSRVMVAGRFGRSGVERVMEQELAGEPGLRFVERDVRAREQLLYHSLDVNPGRDVRVTIDGTMQEVLEQVLDAHVRGLEIAMAVIDAQSGDILAVGGRPLDLEGEGGERVPRLASPAVTWRNAGYVGSLAKPFVLLEQLDAERAGRSPRPHTDFAGCERNYKRIPGTQRMLQCDAHHGSEGRDPALALAKSCNVFFFQAAEGLGLDGLRRAYARAGWCEAVAGEDVRFQPAVSGIPGCSPARVDPRGHALQHVGIGYGVKASALLVARAYAGLATGRLPTLGLLRDRERVPAVDLAIPAADLALVHDGLRRCPLEGTAQSVPGLAEFGVHGKTGTAEVNAADENNAWFAGFVLPPSGRPTLAFAAVAYTVDDHGKESARMVADFLRSLAARSPDDPLRRRWLDGEVGR